MKKEIQLLCMAISFYTRIPIPFREYNKSLSFQQSTRYLPVVGWITGACLALIIIAAESLFSSWVAVVLGITAAIALTGAFHEDGLADAFDGFGGGWTRDKILDIMKDSRVGVYGMLALITTTLLKVMVIHDILNHLRAVPFILLLIATHTFSRYMAVVVLQTTPYVQRQEQSKVKIVTGGITQKAFIVASVISLLPIVIVMNTVAWYYGLIILPAGILTFYLRYYFRKWIGGYTGDCLGAVQQLNEIVLLLSILALWKFF